MLVRKRDGSVRWCIDLRKLNDVTVKDCYPIPLLQDCIDALEGCHMVNLSDVLRRFEQYVMKLKPKKCQLLQDTVAFLGRLVSQEGVQASLGRLLELVIGV